MKQQFPALSLRISEESRRVISGLYHEVLDIADLFLKVLFINNQIPGGTSTNSAFRSVSTAQNVLEYPTPYKQLHLLKLNFGLELMAMVA
ncbi:hypothetical protein TNCV_417901 [Trichonephila clavipes]|nr:hypothetical protein TNCV_417901 [Trichonephila clavipes]